MDILADSTHPAARRVTLLYHALEDMKQVLDNDLDPFEHRELLTELKLVVATATDPNELRLAESLLAFVQSRDLPHGDQTKQDRRISRKDAGCSPDVPQSWC
ncbi:MAG: hypothetical protein IPK16_30310 [Anaerolineales bacterium]|nr:hypothetical protein [Anaerolineales bacterium]